MSVNVLGEQNQRQRLDRGINLVAIVTVVITAATLILAAIAIPGIVRSVSNTDGLKDATEEIRQNTAINQCRALYTNDVTLAEKRVSEANLDLSVLFHQIVFRSGGDRSEALPLLDQYPPLLHALAVAREAREKAIATQRAAIRFSGAHPRRFLADCARR